MQIETHDEQGVAVVGLEGRFDAHETPALRRRFEELLQGGTNRIVVNLGGVSFVDSSALACLVQGMKHCREAGGELQLSSLRQPVRIIFELTRLDRAFGIYTSDAEAIAALGTVAP